MFWLMAATPALAWEGSLNSFGAQMGWLEWPQAYQVNPDNDVGLDPDTTLVSVQRAAEAWALPETLVDLQFDGPTDRDHSAHDQLGTVYFSPDWPWDDQLLAMTSTWSTEGGVLVGFDIAVNQGHPWSLTGDPESLDLQNALTHEFGHALGMAHSKTDPLATMHPTAQFGETHKRDLSDDDAEGLRALYGGAPPPPALVCSAASPAGATWAAGLLALATLLLRGRR